jgi:hypothetical protein
MNLRAKIRVAIETPYNQTIDPHFHLVRTFYLAPIQGAPPWVAGPQG